MQFVVVSAATQWETTVEGMETTSLPNNDEITSLGVFPKKESAGSFVSKPTIVELVYVS